MANISIVEAMRRAISRTKDYIDNKFKKAIVLEDQASNSDLIVQVRNGKLMSSLVPDHIDVNYDLSTSTFYEGDIIEPSDVALFAYLPDGGRYYIQDIENITFSPATATADNITVKYTIQDLEFTARLAITRKTFNPAVELVDFNYTTNADGTYTITGWKGTTHGVAGTEIIIPNSSKVIL